MGWHRADEDTRADHYRDECKNDFPLRLEPRASTTAMEIAVLVKAIDLTTGAALIEQYAHTVAAAARVEETQIAYDRIVRSLESPLSRKEPV